MSLPVPNLDDRQFAALVQQATARIPRYALEWTDHNAHDPGITFLELFAWLAEMQVYYLNRVPAQHELKFLRLLGFSPQPAVSAKAPLTFALANGLTSLLIPQGTPIAAPQIGSNAMIVFETDVDLHVFPITLAQVITSDQTGIRDNTAANEAEGNFYQALGENAEKGSALYLGLEFPASPAAKFLFGLPPENPKLTIMVSLYEKGLPACGAHGEEQIDKISPCATPNGQNERLSFFPSAKLGWEYWNGTGWTGTWADGTPLLAHDLTCAFSWNGNLCFNLPLDWSSRKIPPFGNEYYWLRARVVQPGYEIPPRFESIRLHTILATQGATVTNEILGSSQQLPGQAFKFKHFPLLARTATIEVQEAKGQWKVWEEVPDFDASGPDDEHYLIKRVASESSFEVQFGDGFNGRIPPAGTSNIKAARYRYGGGIAGNVMAETIQTILDDNLESATVTNKQPAEGGADDESLEETRRRALLDLRTPYQAVTSADYESLAKATPALRVERAKALPLLEPPNFTKRNGIVTVAVVPFSFSAKPLPSSGFMRTVCEHLNRHRLITTEVRVVPPDYVCVSVQATVLLKPRVSASTMEENIIAALNGFLHPLFGGIAGKGWEFGRSVYQSEIIQKIEGVSGVDCVMRVALAGQGNFQFEGDNLKLVRPHGLVCPGEHQLELIDPQLRCEIKGHCHELPKQP